MLIVDQNVCFSQNTVPLVFVIPMGAYPYISSVIHNDFNESHTHGLWLIRIITQRLWLNRVTDLRT